MSGSDLELAAYNLLLFKQPVAAFGERGWNGVAQALARAEVDASAFAAPLATRPSESPFPGLAVLRSVFRSFVHGDGDFTAMNLLSAACSRAAARGSRRPGPGARLSALAGAPANPPHGAHIHRAPPSLLVSATHDPSTPYVWAQDVRSQIGQSVLLTRDGDGHASSLTSGQPHQRRDRPLPDHLRRPTPFCGGSRARFSLGAAGVGCVRGSGRGSG